MSGAGERADVDVADAIEQSVRRMATPLLGSNLTSILGFADLIAGKLDVPLELGGLTRQIFIRARNLYGGDAWSPKVVKMLEEACKQPLRAPGFPETLVAGEKS